MKNRPLLIALVLCAGFVVVFLVGTRSFETEAQSNATRSDVLSLRAQRLGEETARLNLLSRITIGSSEEKVTLALEPSFSLVETNRCVGQYPFTQILPYTNRASTAEWRSNIPDENGPAELIVGLFSDGNKTNLIDALSFRNGHVEPVVDGAYNRRLFSLAKGDSMQRVYNELGKRDCEYNKDRTGKWRVKFIYYGLGGRAVVIEADAASGRILSVYDATI